MHATHSPCRSPFSAVARSRAPRVARQDFVLLPPPPPPRGAAGERGGAGFAVRALHIGGHVADDRGGSSNLDLLQPSSRWPGDHCSVLAVLELHGDDAADEHGYIQT